MTPTTTTLALRRRATLHLGLAAAAAVLIGSALPASAGDKGAPKSEGKDAAQFDDLFGAPPAKGTSLDDMKKATEGVGTGKRGDALAPKGGAVSDDAPVQLLSAFAAQHIEIDKTRGCQAAGKEKRKITSWTFDEVPARGVPFEVCLSLASKAGREMQMTVAIVDLRNQRVARAEDVIDFRGKPRIDHVLAFPAPTFKTAGQHFYVIDLDGKEVGRLPLFNVIADGGDGSVPAPVPAAASETPAPPTP